MWSSRGWTLQICRTSRSGVTTWTQSLRLSTSSAAPAAVSPQQSLWMTTESCSLASSAATRSPAGTLARGLSRKISSQLPRWGFVWITEIMRVNRSGLLLVKVKNHLLHLGLKTQRKITYKENNNCKRTFSGRNILKPVFSWSSDIGTANRSALLPTTIAYNYLPQ